MLQIALRPGLRGGRWARLRPLCGHDEALIGGAENTDLVAFVDQLLMEAAGTTVRTGKAAELAVSDFDRLCASIYIDCFGEFIESRAACRTCQEPFEMRLRAQSHTGSGRTALESERTRRAWNLHFCRWTPFPSSYCR